MLPSSVFRCYPWRSSDAALCLTRWTSYPLSRGWKSRQIGRAQSANFTQLRAMAVLTAPQIQRNAWTNDFLIGRGPAVLPFRRCSSTLPAPSGGSPPPELQNRIQARPSGIDTSLSKQQEQKALGASPLRVIELDLNSMEMQRKKIIRRNNFFGVSRHLNQHYFRRSQAHMQPRSPLQRVLLIADLKYMHIY